MCKSPAPGQRCRRQIRALLTVGLKVGQLRKGTATRRLYVHSFSHAARLSFYALWQIATAVGYIDGLTRYHRRPRRDAWVACIVYYRVALRQALFR